MRAYAAELHTLRLHALLKKMAATSAAIREDEKRGEEDAPSSEIRRRSEADAWHVAVADGHFGVSEQEAVDGGDQAAEQAGRRGERNRSGLGHGGFPFSETVRIVVSSLKGNLCIPDARGNIFVCIAAFCALQCNIIFC